MSNAPNKKLIPRHEAMRQKYYMRPYLKDATDAELAERFRHIMLNLSSISPEGKIGPNMKSPNMPYWTEAFTHIIEEYNRRGGIPDGILDENSIPKVTHPDQPTGYKILKGRPAPEPPCAIKLGHKQHIEDMYKKGRILIRPASDYNDPSLNPAIRDDELSISYVALKDETHATLIDGKTGLTKGKMEMRGNAHIKQTATTNYYVYCMCVRYDYRLLDDFQYDSMIVIRDGDTFRDRLEKAVEEKIGLNYEFLDAPVSYFDPYRCNPSDLSAFFSKDFRYAYQKEYRFVWLPKKDVLELEPILIEIGSLEDIAEFYYLDS